VDFYFPGFIAALPLMQGGKLKLLAVATTKRSPAAPDIRRLPRHRDREFRFHPVGRIFRAARDADGSGAAAQQRDQQDPHRPQIKSRLQDDGTEVTPMSIDEFTAFVRGEIDRYPGHHQGSRSQGGVTRARAMRPSGMLAGASLPASAKHARCPPGRIEYPHFTGPKSLL